MNPDLIVGRSEELLGTFPDGMFTCCVTSPPFNVGKDYGNGFDDRKRGEDYLESLSRVFQALRPKMSEDGLLFVNINDNSLSMFKSHEVARMLSGIYHPIQRVIWAKSVAVPVDGTIRTFGQYSPVSSDTRFANSYEFVFIFGVKPKARLNRKAAGIPYTDPSNIRRWNSSGGENLKAPTDVWFFPYATIQNKESRGHPCPFPEDLVRRCISIAPEGPVIDPFGGVGTTAFVAAEMGRPGVSIEQNPEFVTWAMERRAA